MGTYRLPHGIQFSGLMIVFWLKECCRWLIRPPEAMIRQYAGLPNVWLEWAEAEGLALGRRMATGVLPSGSLHEDSIKSRKNKTAESGVMVSSSLFQRLFFAFEYCLKVVSSLFKLRYYICFNLLLEETLWSTDLLMSFFVPIRFCQPLNHGRKAGVVSVGSVWWSLLWFQLLWTQCWQW